MPYDIKKSGSKYAVKKKEGGKVVGRHATKAKAKRQVRAIYANKRK